MVRYEPANSLETPRFSGVRTFMRLPDVQDLENADVAIVGAPFDSGASFRAGARFGPEGIRRYPVGPRGRRVRDFSDGFSRRLNEYRSERLLRLANSARTGGTGLGGLRSLAKGPDEPFEVRVIGALQRQLFSPRASHHRGLQTRVGADEYIVVALGYLTQPLHLILGEVGAVGDPDRPVL